MLVIEMSLFLGSTNGDSPKRSRILSCLDWDLVKGPSGRTPGSSPVLVG